MPAGSGMGRPVRDRRQVIDGIRWRVRAGTPWRDVPARYGLGRPVTSCSGRGSGTARGSASCRGCRRRLMPRASSVGTYRWTPRSCVPIATRLGPAKGDRQVEPPAPMGIEPNDHALGRSRGGWGRADPDAGRVGCWPTRRTRLGATVLFCDGEASRPPSPNHQTRHDIAHAVDQPEAAHPPSTLASTGSVTPWNAASTDSNAIALSRPGTTSSPSDTSPPSTSPPPALAAFGLGGPQPVVGQLALEVALEFAGGGEGLHHELHRGQQLAGALVGGR